MPNQNKLSLQKIKWCWYTKELTRLEWTCENFPLQFVEYNDVSSKWSTFSFCLVGSLGCSITECEASLIENNALLGLQLGVCIVQELSNLIELLR